jgi:hypothetical protein
MCRMRYNRYICILRKHHAHMHTCVCMFLFTCFRCLHTTFSVPCRAADRSSEKTHSKPCSRRLDSIVFRSFIPRMARRCVRHWIAPGTAFTRCSFSGDPYTAPGMSQACIIQALGKRVKKVPTRVVNTLVHVRFEPSRASQ